MMAVQKSLKYLPTGEMINLLLVCKLWGQNMRKSILRRVLIEEKSEQFLLRHRLPLYQAICNPPFSRSVYQRMVDEVPSNTEHLELIKLDARRSLGWD